MTFEPGQDIEVWVSGRWRPARILAVLDSEALLEYETYNYTALWHVDARAVPDDGGKRYRFAKGQRTRRGYYDVSRKWLLKIIEADETWIGQPQSGREPPSPMEMLWERFHCTWPIVGWEDEGLLL